MSLQADGTTGASPSSQVCDVNVSIKEQLAAACDSNAELSTAGTSPGTCMCISGGVTSTAAIFSEAFEAVEHIAGHLAF